MVDTIIARRQSQQPQLDSAELSAQTAAVERAGAIEGLKRTLQMDVPGVHSMLPGNPILNRLDREISEQVRLHGLDHVCRFSEAYFTAEERAAAAGREIRACGPAKASVLDSSRATLLGMYDAALLVKKEALGHSLTYYDALEAGGARDRSEIRSFAVVEERFGHFCSAVRALESLTVTNDTRYLAEAMYQWRAFTDTLR